MPSLRTFILWLLLATGVVTDQHTHLSPPPLGPRPNRRSTGRRPRLDWTNGGLRQLPRPRPDLPNRPRRESPNPQADNRRRRPRRRLPKKNPD
jgi:hypothetical protein